MKFVERGYIANDERRKKIPAAKNIIVLKTTYRNLLKRKVDMTTFYNFFHSLFPEFVLELL